MDKPEILATRDLDSRTAGRALERSAGSTGNAELDARLDDVAHQVCGKHDPAIVRHLLGNVLCAAAGDIEEHDLEMMGRTVQEMLQADEMFMPYRNVRKITCFARLASRKMTPPTNKLNTLPSWLLDKAT